MHAKVKAPYLLFVVYKTSFGLTFPDFWCSLNACIISVAHCTVACVGENAVLTTGIWSGWITCFPVNPILQPSSDCNFNPAKSKAQLNSYS